MDMDYYHFFIVDNEEYYFKFNVYIFTDAKNPIRRTKLGL